MADVVTRLRVESQEFDNKIKNAAEGLKRYQDECKKTGKSLENAEKDALEYVQALGQMDTKTQSVRSQMREFTEALLSLQQQYDSLTDAEKASPFGKAMAASIDQIKQRAAELKDNMGDLDQEIKNMASDTIVFDQIAGAMGTMVSVFQVGQGIIQMFGIENENAVKAMAKLQGAMAVTQGLAQIQNALQKQSTTMMAVATLQKKAMAAAEALDTKAKGANIIVTKAATVAQGALNMVAKANPYVLLASAIAAVGVALIAFAKNSNKAKKAEEDHQKALDKAKEKIKSYSDTVGSSIGGILASYQILRAEWATLSTEQEKMDWIKNQKGEFDKLGISIGNITDAENVFVRNTEKMIKALQLRAQAAALEKLATEEYEDYYQGMQEQGGIVSAGDSAGLYALQLSQYDRAYPENWAVKPQRPEYYDDFTKDASGNYAYTAEGAERENARRAEAAGVSITSGDSYIAQFLAAQQESQRLFEEMGVVVANEVEPAVAEVANAAGDIAQNVEEAAETATGPYMSAFQKLEQSLRIKLADKNMEVDEKSLTNLMSLAIQHGIDSLNPDFERLHYKLGEGLDIPDEAWAELVEEINEQLENLGIEPIEIDVTTGNIKKSTKEVTDHVAGAAQAFQALGDAMNAIDNPGAKVAGLIAQAIGSVVAGYGAATAQAATMGPWAWIAFAASGLATMIATVASIKSVTSGSYANGGIIPGNGISGDNMIASVNSGELILNRAQQSNLANQLNGVGLQGLHLTTELSGENIRIALSNNNRRRGGSRGEYAISK